MGPKAGKVKITASSSGLKTVGFTETAAVGPAANIAVTSGNNQTGPNGTQLPQALTVFVTDQYNNPVSGVSVTFSDGGAGGTFSNPNPGVTSASGTVSQFYTLPPVAGEFVTITATAAGVANPALFTEYGQ
jgi:Bacterial Ig-like domain (group 1)